MQNTTGTGSEFVRKELAFHFAQSVNRNKEQEFLFIQSSKVSDRNKRRQISEQSGPLAANWNKVPFDFSQQEQLVPL